MISKSRPKQIPQRNNNLKIDEKGRRLSLAPTSLAQYLSLDSCDRFLRLYLYKGQTDKLAKDLRERGLGLALQPFGPLMTTLGDRIESKVISELAKQGHIVKNLKGEGFNSTLAALRKANNVPIYLYQSQLEGNLGQWRFEGQADLIRIRLNENGIFEILVADIKASRKDKVSQRLQVAIYVRLLQLHFKKMDLPASFMGAVIRRNPDGSIQNPDQAITFDLDPYFVALEELAEKADSALANVDKQPLENLHYYINQKCDGCLFNPICMVESTARQDIALLPFLESSDKRALTAYNIRTVGQLAALKKLPTPNVKSSLDEQSEQHEVQDRTLHPSPGQEDLVAALSEKWPLGPKLDKLIQRAARVLQRLNPENKDIVSYSYFFNANRSILPDDKETYPDLVKIFLDVQTDYLEERVWLVGAKVVGPDDSQNITRITPGPPTLESERDLLIDWVSEIFKAVVMVSKDPSSTPLQLYLYNRHDQKALLEALRRHLDLFAQVPVLYDLLTETPALTQAAVSFIYDEVKERLNLPSTGHTLQAVATQLGFKWNDGENLLYFRLFARGMFDYLWKQEDGRWIEAAVRCYSTIPLEYAYAVWGVLKAEDYPVDKQHTILPYLKVTADHIIKFQAKRLDALSYIEGHFRFKNKSIIKEPINLMVLGTKSIELPSFAKILEEFLYIEHYAKLQEHLESFGQNYARRVQNGRAMLVKCGSLQETLDTSNRTITYASFTIDFWGTNLEPSAAMQLNKIKKDDFVVLNNLEADGHAWKIIHGRISIVQSIERVAASKSFNIVLKLTDMNFFKTKTNGNNPTNKMSFRYTHENKMCPVVGELYLIDEMVDDLNGDKLLEACRYAGYNPFYHLIALPNSATTTFIDPVDIAPNRQATPTHLELAAKFGEIITKLDYINAPTLYQNEVITQHLTERIFLVQGPPGTGKSHTLGWAVLARIYTRLARGEHLRVIISCQTHNAVNIVLQSVAAKLAKLHNIEDADLFLNLRIFKIGEEENEANDALDVEKLDPWLQRSKLGQILNSQALVIGATPGGLYRLMKQRTKYLQGQDVLWQEKPFDLVILDEASQMNLPQALLASSWLQENGQLIVVGDHRQMAPILVHGWDEEDRLSAVQTHPYRSVFKYLIDQGFPRVALDESFRLHRIQAAFLHNNIYVNDGIQFHSRREQLLPTLPMPEEPYIQAIMNSAYPIIVVEHSERNSQQANLTEADLITPIIKVCQEMFGFDGDEGIGVVVPHRAQKALLSERFPDLAAKEAIDTVERFQGGEREVIIVSATASDPDYVSAEADFLLNPNRLNVALSRPRQKLIVVASQAVFKFLSSDLDTFDQATLWKRLVSQCADECLWSGEISGTSVKVYGCRA